MTDIDPIAHGVSIVLAVPTEEVVAFLSSGLNQSYWALGSWARVDEGHGVVSGTSLWDGSKLYIRVEPHPELGLIDWYTGVAPDALRLGVSARVRDGEPLGHPAGSSVLSFTVWHGKGHTDESWARTYHAFIAESHLIKGRLEHGVTIAARAAGVQP
jgi:hypothetical protein